MGRSLLILFAAPFVWRIVFYVWNFFRLVFSLVMQFFAGSEPKGVECGQNMFWRYFVSLPDYLYYNFVAYMVDIGVLAALALAVYAAYRFLRNAPFGKKQYLRIWCVVFIGLYSIRPIHTAYMILNGAHGATWGMFAESALIAALVAWVLCMFARAVLAQKNYADGGRWKGEIGAKEFFGDNYLFFKTKLFTLGFYKIAVILFALFALDFFKFTLWGLR